MRVGEIHKFGHYSFLPILDLDIDGKVALPIRQAGQGFANERSNYFARANAPLPFCAFYGSKSKLLIDPMLLSQYFYTFPYPLEMTDDVHILTGFGEPSKITDTTKELDCVSRLLITEMGHSGVDFLCEEGTPVKSVDNGLVICAIKDHRYDELSNVYIYNPHNKAIWGYDHLDTSSIPKEWFNIDFQIPETLIPINQEEYIGEVSKFPGTGIIHRDIYLEPDVEAKYGRKFDHLHLSCEYFEGDISAPEFEGNIFFIVEASLALNPMLFLQRLY